MMWKIIGQSVAGASHIAEQKGCEDAVAYQWDAHSGAGEVIMGFVSDGAGSAKYGAYASAMAVSMAVETVQQWLDGHIEIEEQHLAELAEGIYDRLENEANANGEPLNEYSCTLLGAIILPGKACYLQIGDGAIVRNLGDGRYTHVWWPQNGEYQNATVFVVDDPGLKDLKVKVVQEAVMEVALFTDGLQMLALNNEQQAVHQPFFKNLFLALQSAKTEEQVEVLNSRLAEYLAGSAINNRTDDDKTLLLATKIMHRGRGI